MNTTNETSLTKAPDPVHVFMCSSLGTSSGSGAFNGLEMREVSLEHTGPTNPLYQGPISAAEDLTDSPVASGMGAMAFRFMAETARDQGFISQRGLENVMKILYPEVDHA